MLSIAIDVQVVGIDGVDDANVRMESQEGMVKLIGLHNQSAIRAFTQKQVAIEVVGNAADEGGGVHFALMQNMSNHSRGCSLAMRASHRDGEVTFRDFAQSFSAFQNRQVALSEGLKLLEVVRHGRSVDDRLNEGGQ